MRDFVRGIGLFGRGLFLILRSPRLLLIGAAPALLTGLLLLGGLVALTFWVDDLAALVTPFADNWVSGLREAIRVAISVALFGAALVIGVLSFSALTIAIGGPFYEHIAEKLEDILEAEDSLGTANPAGTANAAAPAGWPGPANSAGTTNPAIPADSPGPANPADTTNAAAPADWPSSANPAGTTNPAAPAGSHGPANPAGDAYPASPAGSPGPANPAGTASPAGLAASPGSAGTPGPAGTAPPTPAGSPGPAGPPPVQDLSWGRLLWLGLRDGVLLILRSLLFTIPLVIAGFVPVVGQTVVPVLLALMTSWFLALELVAVSFYRRGMDLEQRRAVMSKRRALAVGFGLPASLLCAIPLLAIIVMPVAFAGGVLLAHEAMRDAR